MAPSPRPAADRARSLGFGALIATLALATGCAGFGDEYRPADTTPDGLQQVPSYRVWGAYADPAVDLTAYRKVRFEFGGIQYRGDPALAPGARPLPGGTPRSGRLSPSDEERLRRYFRETFEREFGAPGRWELTQVAGPDTLTVRAHALDMVTPIASAPRGAETRFSSRAPTFTMVLDVRDSVTDAPLARVVDRRRASPRIGAPIQSNGNTLEPSGVRRVMRRWAQALRRHLERLRA